ncbi:SMP-30/gluconolactonase/LRE family protein [bacterium]|nr:SMP-30/gluconolactonase/LRE family protein [bacterium]
MIRVFFGFKNTILIWIFAIYSVSAGILYAQTLLNNPESVAYDAKRDRFLVSNKGDGKIIEIDYRKREKVLNASQPSVRGLQVWGDRLYAAGSLGVMVIDLETGRSVRRISIPGSIFLNDITVDINGFLYVSDTNGGKIYKIRISDGHVSILAQGLDKPNGLLYDARQDRLLVCFMKAASPIQAVDCQTGAVTLVKSTNLSNCDGLSRDAAGRIYVSSWTSGSVYRFDPDFIGGPVLISSGHHGPADIFVRPIADVLVVPNFQSGTVDFISIKP